jgi:hypothetical protein
MKPGSKHHGYNRTPDSYSDQDKVHDALVGLARYQATFGPDKTSDEAMLRMMTKYNRLQAEQVARDNPLLDGAA